MPSYFYNKNANQLAEQYLSQSFEQIHQNWISYLPEILSKPNAHILDVGAGAGRDAKYLAEQGKANNIKVIAAEPARLLAEIGQLQTLGENVHWLEDSLPDLTEVIKLKVNFELILLSAIWTHIPYDQRITAIEILTKLLKPGGKLVITLRYGISGDERPMHKVCVEELKQVASQFGLKTELETEIEGDKFGRGFVQWQSVVLGRGLL